MSHHHDPVALITPLVSAKPADLPYKPGFRRTMICGSGTVTAEVLIGTGGPTSPDTWFSVIVTSIAARP